MSQSTKKEPVPEHVNKITQSVLNAAYEVHTAIGPGLLESIYETCLAYELRNRGHLVEKQVSLPVIYKGIQMDAGLRMDLIVDNCIIIEIKAVDELLPIHEAQLLTYLKLTGYRIGLLMNFNSCHLKDGIKRIAH
ncbi:GxxExxY protein [Methanocella conradii]|uniref:GxxExxY protein n=1 Tax=Methanocella conradii TaxID=1175444 RepID=UPI00157CA843|nr:GxxExxY protein [Methanocella conradii]